MEKMTKLELEMLDDLIAYEREIYILKLKIKDLELENKKLLEIVNNYYKRLERER